jgi:hypothetical protein
MLDKKINATLLQRGIPKKYCIAIPLQLDNNKVFNTQENNELQLYTSRQKITRPPQIQTNPTALGSH